MELCASRVPASGVVVAERSRRPIQVPTASCSASLPTRRLSNTVPIVARRVTGSPACHARVLSAPTSLPQQRAMLTPPRAASGAAPAGSGDAPPSLAPVLRAVFVACMGAFAFGYHLGVVNGPLEAIAADLGFAGNKGLQGLVVSSTLLGAAIGSFTGGGFADALGRRKSFILAAIPMAAGPLLSATSGAMEPMVAGRFLAGLAIGLSSALVPVYISEVSPTAIRGTLGSLNQLMICLGILGALVANVAVPVAQWRTMFYLAAVPAIVLAIGMLAAPESPVYLARSGQRGEAESVAKQLWGPGGASQLPVASAGGGAEKEGGWADCFASPFRRAVLIGCVLFVFQQFSGINALIYFSSSVFKQAGISNDALASAAVGATNVLGTLIATGLIEKAGRKQLLSQSYLGMALAMSAMALGFWLPSLAPYSGVIALGGTLFYILSFAIGAGPITGLIVPELNSAAVRGKAVSLAMVTHWICNVAIGQSFMSAVASYGISIVYAFFGACCLLGALYIASNVPETKGKSFDDIAKELAG